MSPMQRTGRDRGNFMRRILWLSSKLEGSERAIRLLVFTKTKRRAEVSPPLGQLSRSFSKRVTRDHLNSYQPSARTNNRSTILTAMPMS